MEAALKKVRSTLSTIQELRQLPRETIALTGPESRFIYREFTRPHPRYKLMQRKKWGVALLKLEGTFEDYSRGKSRQALRTNLKKAKSKGLSTKLVLGADYIDDVLDISNSASTRQGKAISSDYTSRKQLEKHFEPGQKICGAFNKEGKLVGYAEIIELGEVAVVSRVMGHDEWLKNGVMYLLLSDIVKRYLETENCPVKWFMYDTYFGAASGLQYFKRRMGFSPYVVHWKRPLLRGAKGQAANQAAERRIAS